MKSSNKYFMCPYCYKWDKIVECRRHLFSCTNAPDHVRAMTFDQLQKKQAQLGGIHTSEHPE